MHLHTCDNERRAAMKKPNVGAASGIDIFQINIQTDLALCRNENEHTDTETHVFKGNSIYLLGISHR